MQDCETPDRGGDQTLHQREWRLLAKRPGGKYTLPDPGGARQYRPFRSHWERTVFARTQGTPVRLISVEPSCPIRTALGARLYGPFTLRGGRRSRAEDQPRINARLTSGLDDAGPSSANEAALGWNIHVQASMRPG